MSIFLRKSNWLVADWVMRKLLKDLIVIDDKKRYTEFYEDLLLSEKKYTYLLDYSQSEKNKITQLHSLVRDIVQGYEKGVVKFEGNIESLEAYKLKLNELERQTEKEI